MAHSINGLGQEVPVYAAPKAYGPVVRLFKLVNNATDKVADTLSVWKKRAIYRNELAVMPREILADIGMDVLTARREANKPFWMK